MMIIDIMKLVMVRSPQTYERAVKTGFSSNDTVKSSNFMERSGTTVISLFWFSIES